MTIILRPLALETRKNRPIRNLPRLDKPPHFLRALVTEVLHNHPRLRLRSATGVYNCFGLPLAARRTWVDFDEDQELLGILSDDGYRLLPPDESPEPGDLVLYKDDQNRYAHVAVILHVTPTVPIRFLVLSQWGQLGEYIHDHVDVPQLYGKPAEYWTDRVAIP